MSYYIDRPRARWPWVLALLALLALAWPAYITYNRAYAGAVTAAYLLQPIVIDGKVVQASDGKPLRRIDIFEAFVQHTVKSQ